MNDITELWKAFQEWVDATCETDARLELEHDGSGCIRMEEWMGDWTLRRSLLDWNTIEEGIAALRQEIEQGYPYPSVERFRDEADPSRVTRRKRRELVRRLGTRTTPGPARADETAPTLP